ncbi:MAG: NUDIX domain-containing protein [Acidobacteria bacterium]|nr:NUDIX domain-containing protein [Acidobacteriota bacterium]
MSAIVEFGTRVGGVDYRLRLGGYVVLRNDVGDVAILETRSGTFLPGGGQEGDETPELAAMRESLEECGFVVRLGDLVGVADELVFGEAERAHFRKRCTFFKAVVVDRAAGVVPEHTVSWVPPEEAVARLSHGSQRWAVTRVCHPD